jgi:hypothetical protein
MITLAYILFTTVAVVAILEALGFDPFNISE